MLLFKLQPLFESLEKHQCRAENNREKEPRLHDSLKSCQLLFQNVRNEFETAEQENASASEEVDCQQEE
jgi:hypothetical protein